MRRFGAAAMGLFMIVGVALATSCGETDTRLADDRGPGEAAATAPESVSDESSTSPAIAPHTSRFETSVSSDGVLIMSVRGAIDLDNELFGMSASSAERLFGPSFGPGPVDAVFDFENGVLYVTSEGQGLGTDVPWVAYDMALIAMASGTTTDELQDELIGNITPTPHDASDLLELDDAQHIGSEIIDGGQFEHYRVAGQGFLEEAIEADPELGGEISEQAQEVLAGVIVTDVWMTSDRQLRRMVMTSEVDGAIVVSEMNVTDIGVPIVIELPVPNEVIAFEDI